MFKKGDRLSEREKVIRNEIKNYLQELQQSPDFAPLPSTHDEIREIKKLRTNSTDRRSDFCCI